MFDSENQNVQTTIKLPRSNGGLCGVPYRALRKQALDVQINLKQGDTETSVSVQSNDRLTVDSKNCKALPDSNNNESLLWVEKFRPKNFLELLSDDGTNRTLLRWLKLWDKVVFNKEIKLKKPQNDQNESNPINDQIAKASPTEVIENDKKRKSRIILYIFANFEIHFPVIFFKIIDRLHLSLTRSTDQNKNVHYYMALLV